MTSGLRWGRIVLGGLFGEVMLFAVIIPMGAAGSGEAAITVAAVAGSFLVFVPVAWWLTRSVARPILHGALMGAVAAALYIALAIAYQLFNSTAPSVPVIYYVGHALKLAGGATGGWLAARSTVAVPDQRVRVG